MTSDATDNQEQQRLTVYFDGACPLCRREITFYQRLNGANKIQWCDVSDQHDESIEPGLTREAALKRFHVRRADGKLASGATAFAELWMALPAFAWSGRILALPGVRHAAELVYRAFLVVRPLVQRAMPR